MCVANLIGCSLCECYSPSGRLRACVVTDMPKGKKAESKEQQYLEVCNFLMHLCHMEVFQTL